MNVRIDAIGGLTMGADPISLSIGIAAQLESPGTPLQNVHGAPRPSRNMARRSGIEGNFAEGDTVVVVDDVVTTGGSTLQAIDAVEAEGGKVAFVIALVDRLEGGRQNIEARGYPVFPFFTRADVLSKPA